MRNSGCGKLTLPAKHKQDGDSRLGYTRSQANGYWGNVRRFVLKFNRFRLKTLNLNFFFRPKTFYLICKCGYISTTYNNNADQEKKLYSSQVGKLQLLSVTDNNLEADSRFFVFLITKRRKREYRITSNLSQTLSLLNLKFKINYFSPFI